VRVRGLGGPIVVDVLKVKGNAPARYDLPLHYNGHLIDTGFALKSNVTTRPVLGTKQGYQHLWVDATGTPDASDGRVTWMTAGRFYSYRMATPGMQVILAESGANDPKFNLRREPAIIQRLDGAKDATFVSLLEAHGRYDASTEMVSGSASAVASVTQARAGDADIVTITLVDGRRVILAVADDVSPGGKHSANVAGRAFGWTGPIGRMDREAGT
jgi:hypothetical protein